jgi:hypothetical protein
MRAHCSIFNCAELQREKHQEEQYKVLTRSPACHPTACGLMRLAPPYFSTMNTNCPQRNSTRFVHVAATLHKSTTKMHCIPMQWNKVRFSQAASTAALLPQKTTTSRTWCTAQGDLDRQGFFLKLDHAGWDPDGVPGQFFFLKPSCTLLLLLLLFISYRLIFLAEILDTRLERSVNSFLLFVFCFCMIISRGWGSHTMGKSIVVWNAWLACTILHPRETRLILHNCCINFLSRDMIVLLRDTQTNCVQRERERERERACARSFSSWTAFFPVTKTHNSRIVVYNNRFWNFVSLQQHKCMSILFSLQKEWLHACMHPSIIAFLKCSIAKFFQSFCCCTVVRE